MTILVDCWITHGNLSVRRDLLFLQIALMNFTQRYCCRRVGRKLLGAGGGGFLVFYVQPEHQDAVRLAMRDLLYIPFKFEDGGTRVIHYTPEDYTPKD